MPTPYFYRPDLGHGLPHNPLKALVAPRPIAWVSSLSATGIPNLAPYSFFNLVCETPPMVAFSSEGRKDSLANIEATGEFTCNLATRALAQAMSASAAPYPADVDEFEAAGLDKSPGQAVACPRVAASPAALECRLVDLRRLHALTGAETNNWLVIGQVVGVHIAGDYLVEGLFDTARAGLIQRAGYIADYAEATPASFFTLPRPL